MLTRTFKLGLILAVALSGAALSIAAINDYPGSKPLYILFSGMFWLLLFTTLGKRTHYGYFFLSIALWLGFWGKITAHLILKYPYVEPIGRFDGSAAAWDNALWVAIMASAGMMLGKLVFSLTQKKYSRTVDIDQAKVPSWYLANRKWVWIFSLVLVVGVAILNMILGIHQIGLVPRTILPWPLNALIAWQVSIGSALLVTTLLWWEMALKKNIALSIYTVFIEAITSTATLLSRGVYIFHTLPQLFALFENRRRIVGISRVTVAVLLLIFAGLMVFSIAGVTTFRAYMYPHAGGFTTEEQQRLTRLEVLDGGIAHVKILIAQGEPQEGHLRELLAEKAQLEKVVSSRQPPVAMPVGNKTEKVINVVNPASGAVGLSENKDKILGELQYQMSTGALPRILSLVVDRWIGLEGVMAVTSYPEKSPALLTESAMEKRAIGKSTKYQEICSSHYRWVDANNWQFASLPGAAAFLYFSGSLWVVLLGMALFAFILQLGEQLVLALTSNPLLCSLFGLTLANSIAQFGIAPRQDIPFYSMIIGSILLISAVQSGVGGRLGRRVRSYCGGGA